MPNWPDIVFWMLAAMSTLWAVMQVRQGIVQRGWLVVFATIMAVALVGKLLGQPVVIGVAGALWLVFVCLPSILSHASTRQVIRERYGPAKRLADLAAMLHPADGWPGASRFIDAVALTARGDEDGAVAVLEPLCRLGNMVGQRANLLRCRLTHNWAEILAWSAANPGMVDRDAELLAAVLRALGETGDTAGMVDLYRRHRKRIGAMPLAILRDSIQLNLFALAGHPEGAERILGGSLAAAPPLYRDYWLATAHLRAGGIETARADFERLLVGADDVWAKAIRRRIAASHEPIPPLDESRQALVAEEATSLEAEIRFGKKGPPSASASPVTWSLVALNGLAFALQLAFDGSTDLKVLHDLGALCADCVGRGEWWRLLTATFLHLGPLHLIMNLGALATLGPQAEAGLGRGRTLVVYFLAGVGSMAVVAAQSWITGERLIAVGASGAVMGLIGATAAMMLRGWFNEGAVAARNRCLAMAGVVLAQMVIDTLVPQLSFTAHLSGAVIGFVATLLLGDRLGRPVPGPAA
jgi:rhomboid protease GluP